MAIPFKTNSDHHLAKTVLVVVFLIAAVFGLMVLINHYFIQKALVQKEPVTFLVIGNGADSGSAKVSGQLASNTMVLVFCNPGVHQVSLLSIPQNSNIFSDESRNDALTPDQTSQVVSRQLGVPIDHYLAVDQQGFKELVDLVGGIVVNFPAELHYRDRWGRDFYRFAPGRQVLDGEKALIYVKLTETGNDEIGRVQRQQEFLRAVLQKIRSKANILRLAEYNSIIRKHLKTDLKFEEALKIGNFLKQIKLEDIKGYILPGRENDGVWEPDRNALVELLQKLEP